MPTVIGHSLVALTACGLLRLVPTGRALSLTTWVVFLVGASLLPDLDVLALRWLPYSHPLSHRGFWHSLPFAALATLGMTAMLFWAGVGRLRRANMPAVWGVAALVMASHGLLDALTDGGLGVALWSPLSQGRHFFAWQPIPVAWLSPARIFSPYMRGVYGIELALFGPFCLAAWVLSAKALEQRLSRFYRWLGAAALALLGLTAWAGRW